MRLSILCFALGICWLQVQAHLPDAATLVLLAGLSAGLWLAALAMPRYRVRAALPVGAFLLGICWAGSLAQLRMADALAEADEGRDIRIVGIVRQMPQAFDNGISFDFTVEQAAASAIAPRMQ